MRFSTAVEILSSDREPVHGFVETPQNVFGMGIRTAQGYYGSENREYDQTAGLFRLLCTIFPCNTQSIPAEKWLQQAKNPSLLVIFPVFR